MRSSMQEHVVSGMLSGNATEMMPWEEKTKTKAMGASGIIHSPSEGISASDQDVEACPKVSAEFFTLKALSYLGKRSKNSPTAVIYAPI
jgi:hypothetical protein